MVLSDVSKKTMTLIAQLYDPSDGFLAIGDTLISYVEAYDGDANLLPLQTGLNLGFGTHAVRLASKAVIFDNYIVLWAGDVSAAKKLIHLFMSIHEPTYEDFRGIIDNNPELSNKVSLIFAHNDGEGTWSGSWSCSEKDFKNVTCIAAGTGAEDFLDFDSVAPLSPEFYTNDKVPASALGFHRFGGLIFHEMTEFIHKYSVFGGAYEFFAVKEGGGFERVSYSLSEISMKRHLEEDYVDYAGQSPVICALGLQECTVFLVQIGDGLDENRFEYRSFVVSQITDPNPPRITKEQLTHPFRMSFCYILGTQFDWHLAKELHSLNNNVDTGDIWIKTDVKKLNAIIQGFYDRGHGLYAGKPNCYDQH